MTDCTEAFPVLDSSDGGVACPEVTRSLPDLLELVPSLDAPDGLVACPEVIQRMPELFELESSNAEVADVDTESSSATVPCLSARGERMGVREFRSTRHIPSFAELSMHDEAELP
jgi:hypothetical protein